MSTTIGISSFLYLVVCLFNVNADFDLGVIGIKLRS